MVLHARGLRRALGAVSIPPDKCDTVWDDTPDISLAARAPPRFDDSFRFFADYLFTGPRYFETSPHFSAKIRRKA